MKLQTIIAGSLLSILVAGCASLAREHAWQVTIPNGSSPAKANAVHASMNDNLRSGSWNHGNGYIWVSLGSDSTIQISEPADKDSRYDFKGYSRIKFGWWRGVPGKFTIEGHRLDASAPALGYSIHENAYGPFGFMPSYLYFPSEGYWKITAHLGRHHLTFVVHVVKGPDAAN